MSSILERVRASDALPPDAIPAQKALWLELRGDWAAAHEMVLHPTGTEEILVHAFLHRIEGDHGNAAYWYRRAGVAACRLPLDQERTHLLDRLFPAGL